MPRRATPWILVAVAVIGAVVAVADSMDIVNDAMCGTPRSFERCYQPVLIPTLVGGAALAALTLLVVGVAARRRASVVVLLGAAAIGVVAGSPVLATAPAADGCNHVSGYLPRVVASHADWLAVHDVVEPSGGYETLMSCISPEDAAAAQADVALDGAATILVRRPLDQAVAFLSGRADR